MANLKGSTFQRQIKDALIRLDARGKKRTGEYRYDGLAHSRAVLDKRHQALRDFSSFIESKDYQDKLNTLLTQKILEEFLIERTADMSLSTIENYISNLSALVKGLRLKNITIPDIVDYEYFQRMKDRLGRPDPYVYQTGRYMDDDTVRTMLESLPHRSRVVALIQYKLCFRASEALLVANNPDKYLLGCIVSGVKGKGGQLYPEKTVDINTANMIRSAEAISRATYYRDQRKILKGKHRPHDLRLTHICELYDSLRDNGVNHHDAMIKASKASNHHRASTTGSYQARR